ncbi:MAG TPA: protein kinase [Gemmatimonadaceae bacterium]|nr:protein kinase [Gemmatimonadaceae bacterium]
MSLSRERELFEAAILLPPDARESWLAENCESATMRARIDDLLRAHDRAEARDALRAPLPLDLQIGPYRLLERIGEGAMGEVYLAEQAQPVVRRVALKVIKPGMDSREVIARFESERQTLALMSHPSIAHIIDAGTTAAGRPYFAMEYVPGIPVTHYCDRHRLGIDHRLELFLQICSAVQHAHQKGVIHRDLKPSNLLVADLDGKPVPKVIDFGISKAMSALHEPGRAHTRIGHLIGTPEYMSPEQAQLSPLDVDTRSDIYSLGVVLHELLTGLLPFKASDSTATPAVLVQELLTHDPAAPSARVNDSTPLPQAAAAARHMSVRQLAARLSGDLDWIVLKALEKDRNRRYASPSELAADIRRHLANEPVTAGPPSAVYRMRKFAARHRLALALMGGVFAATLAFGALMARQAREIAVQRDEAKFQALRAEASSEFMSLMLEEVGSGGRALTSLELLERGVELLDKRYGDDPEFQARMLLQMSRRFMDLGSTDKQAELLARAESLARVVENDELLAAVNCAIVRSELDANRPEQARLHLQAADSALARIEETPLATRIDCLRAQAEVAEIDRDLDAAAARLTSARALLETSGSIHGLQYNSVLTDLGGIYFRTGRYQEALEINESTAAALDRNGRGGTLGRVTLSVNRASLLYRLGEIRLAEATGREALSRLESASDAERATPIPAIRYAATLNRLDRTREALELLTPALEQTRAQGNEFWGAQARYNLGRAQIGQRNFEQARQRLDEVEALWGSNAATNLDRLADLSRTRAELDLARDRLKEAAAHIDKSLTMFGYPAKSRTPDYSAALTLASRIYMRSAQPDQAQTFATAALRITESVARDPAQSADVGEALLALAVAQDARGDRTNARNSAQRAFEALSHSLGADHRLSKEAADLRQRLAR